MSRHRKISSHAGGRVDRGTVAHGPSQRQLRVGEMLRHAISDILRETQVRDPELDGVSVTVTQHKRSPDMRHATVFVEPLGGGNADVVVAALNRARGVFRGALGHTITLKFTPELRFVEDTSFQEANRIESILKSDRVSRDIEHDESDLDADEMEADDTASEEPGEVPNDGRNDGA
jgi:ribosome-binding factor A